MAIDFTAIIRGERAATAQRAADQRNRQNDVLFNFEQQQRLVEAQGQTWDRQAASYTAPLLTNQQQAASAGMNSLDFFIGQRNAALEDPNFKNFSPEVQQRILAQLGGAAQVTADQYIQAGDSASARRLLESFGVGNSVPERNIAYETGDSAKIISALDPSGSLLRNNQDGTFTHLPSGTRVGADRLAGALSQGGGIQALPSAIAVLQNEDATLAQRLDDQRRATALGYMGAGFMQQPDGTWRDAAGRVLPAIEGATAAPAPALPAGQWTPPMLLPAGGVPQTPLQTMLGGAAAPAVVAPVAPTAVAPVVVTPPAVPVQTTLQSLLGTALPAAPAAPAAPVAPVAPAAPAVRTGGFDTIRNAFDSLMGPVASTIAPSPVANPNDLPVFPGDDDALAREVLNNLTDPASYDLLVKNNPQAAQRFQAALELRGMVASFGDAQSKKRAAVFNKARGEIEAAFARSAGRGTN